MAGFWKPFSEGFEVLKQMHLGNMRRSLEVLQVILGVAGSFWLLRVPFSISPAPCNMTTRRNLEASLALKIHISSEHVNANLKPLVIA